MQVMIDHANEEQDVRDLSNFLALLLRGAEVSTGASLILTFLVSPSFSHSLYPSIFHPSYLTYFFLPIYLPSIFTSSIHSLCLSNFLLSFILPYYSFISS